jgi:hypothetical protein
VGPFDSLTAFAHEPSSAGAKAGGAASSIRSLRSLMGVLVFPRAPPTFTGAED